MLKGKYVARILEDDNLESKATDSSLWKAIFDSSHHIGEVGDWEWQHCSCLER